MSNTINVNVSRQSQTIQVNGRTAVSSAAGSQDTVRSLETGERLSGKIVSMSDEGGVKSAQIRLDDNTVISAKLNEGMYLREGQTLSFEVRGTGGSQITLTPLYENTSADPTTLKALSAAGIEVNPDTVNMVKSMMENGLSIDRDSLGNMYKALMDHPTTDTSTLSQMKALSIPITDQNIAQFESYKNYEHQVVETMDSIMEELPTAYNELIQAGKGEAANDLYGQILNMLSEGAESMAKEGVLAGGEALANGTEVAAQVSEEGAQQISGALGEITEEGLAEQSTAEVIVSAEDETGAQSTKVNTQNLQEDIAGKVTEGNKDVGKEAGDKAGEALKNLADAGNIAEETAVSKDAEGNTAKVAQIRDGSDEKNASLQNDAKSAGAAENRITFSKDFADIIRELRTGTEASGTEIDKLLEQARTGKEVQIDRDALLKELSEAYNNKAHTSENADAAFTKLFGNNEYSKLMKGAMKNQWLLKPEEVREKDNVENLYSRLNSQAKELTEALTKTLGQDSKVAQSAVSLQNNIEFMDQLNQMFHYVQLPLKMADQDAHGELYVYSNGKKKFEPGETVSAILHLDMDNLGPLDVYVKMKDNNVKTNFYVADEATIDLIAEHIDILNERLNKRGYNMEAKMMLHTDLDSEGSDAAVDEMLDVKKMPVVSMTSFDARA